MRSKKPYHKRKPSGQAIAHLCGEAWPEDGIDPRATRRGYPAKPPGRKMLQLCMQVQHALQDALAAVCNDPLLQDLHVLSVAPAAGSGRLFVMLQVPADVPVDPVSAHLARAAGMLRCEVAAAITRKKVPELVFGLVQADATS